MNGKETLENWFSGRALLHPVSDVPSFVDLIRLFSLYSGGPEFPMTRGMNDLRSIIEPADHLVFVLVDGLGLNLTSQFPSGGFFAETLKAELRAVFPSTTAAALTTLASGAWPGAHGITGWWTYFSEKQRTICPLRFLDRTSMTSATKFDLHLDQLLPVRSMYHGFFRESRSYLPRPLDRGEYSEWSRGGTKMAGYRTFDQLVRMLSRATRKAKRATFSYVYSMDVDSRIHRNGTADEQVYDAVRQNDYLLTRLRDALPESARIIATADHGLIDVPDGYTTEIRSTHPLLSHLAVPPSGESSTPIFHVIAQHESAFLTEFERSGLADRFALITPDQAGELHLYGPEPISPLMRSHLGSWIGIAREPYVLEFVPDNLEPIHHRGVHGGLRPEEMRVGLFTA